ncbi:serine/threonine protein kinase [Cellulomonas sp. H30R-01]|uniref:serine/threonine-protein kinase n=1 Tax=Cellulomonas sp. H30R-01 TaxID=2704467 RepID=UPI00138D0966|nr:serine/threonine-protein kinase [Cellulomonas sp. H30R-01]QHT57488.1 serine/threonine protein kinase [Cellulomonas sp. H30R-01]
MRTAAGVALDGRYRLIKPIATGGMGEVWEAHDDALARPVAVKVLKEEFAGDPGFLERFRTEARNSASLHHPSIAQLFDYGEQDGSAFLVMELVVGEPLSDLLEREPVLTPRRLLPILAQTARALHAAHTAGVVHRDVKPGNILLGRGGRVKITDFGVSLAQNQITMTATGMVMGTAQYLSPEQAVGKAATPLSDLYSLGVVAYEALVGHRPFTGPTAVDIAVAHVNNAVPPLPSSVDKPLAALVMRLLSKDPAQRPQSGEELAGLFDKLVPRTPPSGIPVLVSKISRPADTFATAVTTARGTSDAPPPTYPPRRTRRDEPRARVSGTPRHVNVAALRTSGPRLGRFSRFRWPLLALVLLLVALLGAALANGLTRAAPLDGPPGAVVAHSTSPRDDGSQYPRRGSPDGMISVDGRGHDSARPLTTEVKDA